MPSDRALERLHDHQHAILSIIAGAEPMLTDPNRRDVAGLARARWALMRALTAYAMFKQREVFDPALAKARPADAGRVLRMKRACTELGDAFRGYVQKWSAADVEAQWAAYQPAALAMSATIKAHVARERDEVGALLAKAA